MKNYHDTKHELEILKLRLEILKEKKESLKSIIEPKSVITDKILIDQSKRAADESIVKYIYLLSQIQNETEEKTKRILYLEEKLKVMEQYLREIKDVKYKVFVMYYIENFTIQKISDKLNYSERRIYQILKKIGLNI